MILIIIFIAIILVVAFILFIGYVTVKNEDCYIENEKNNDIEVNDEKYL